MTPEEDIIKRQQVTALKDSIEHWRRLSTGQRRKEEGIGAKWCALCDLYYAGGCKGCPIYQYTRQIVCRNTPYTAVQYHIDYYEGDDDLYDTAEFKALARDEQEFLELLLTNLTMLSPTEGDNL